MSTDTAMVWKRPNEAPYNMLVLCYTEGEYVFIAERTKEHGEDVWVDDYDGDEVFPDWWIEIPALPDEDD